MGDRPKVEKVTEPLPAIKLGDLVLDRYRVIEQIASGGHSVVFRGLDERLQRPVCVKVFSGLGGQSGLGRTSYEHFIQEAFALSRLTHPNTLRIYDFGHVGAKDIGGMPLQVCEFMNGGTLSSHVREQGKQTVAETTKVIAAMCAALAEAHALGIVHRDIKPQNILFGTVGQDRLPKLADFGIAKWSADEDHDRSQRAEDTAIVAGQKLAMYSPSWAAPEQLAGQPVSNATDVYSLACVAVYMLTGKAIFADEDVYAGYKKRRHADELVRDALTPLQVPRDVIDLLTRALAFDPKQRLLKIELLATELLSLIEPETEQARLRPSSMADVTNPRVRPSDLLEPLTPPTSRHAITPFAGTPRVEPPVIAPDDAPTPPPVIPAMPRAYLPPPSLRAPWMASAQPPQHSPNRLPLSDIPVIVGDRRMHFVLVVNDVVDLIGVQNTKIRVTILMGPTGRTLHVKGLSCFIAPLGGRPSPAVQVEHSCDLALVTPRAQEIGHIRVLTSGTPDRGMVVFPIGIEAVGVAIEDCIDPILFDFGPASDGYFIYTRGRSIPKLRR